MRITLNLPEALLDDARATLGFTSKTDTVVCALREVVRRGRRDDLKTLLGRVTFDRDPTEIRKKDRARRTTSAAWPGRSTKTSPSWNA